MNHVRTARSRFAAPLAIFAGLVITAAVLFFTVNNSTADASSQTISGHWIQSGEGYEGVVMDAEVSPGSIQINMKTSGSEKTLIYWMGTFDTDHSVSSVFETTSLADPDAQKNSLFGSRDSTKFFKYDHGVITFKFSMMGTSADVHLAKQ